MSHTGVDVIDFLFYAIYPVIGIFAVEGISRLVKAPKWIKLVDSSCSINWIWNILLVYPTCTTKLSANSNGDVCIGNCTNLSGKACKNLSRQESLLVLESSKNSPKKIWPVSSTITYDFSLAKSFCPDLA